MDAPIMLLALPSHRSISLVVVVNERVPFSSSLPSRMPSTTAHTTQSTDSAEDMLAVEAEEAAEVVLVLAAAAVVVVVGGEAVLRHCRIRAASTPPCDTAQASTFNRERDAPLQQSLQVEDEEDEEDGEDGKDGEDEVDAAAHWKIRRTRSAAVALIPSVANLPPGVTATAPPTNSAAHRTIFASSPSSPAPPTPAANLKLATRLPCTSGVRLSRHSGS